MVLRLYIFCITLVAMLKTYTTKKQRRGWKQTTVRLDAVTAATFDGPGDDFVLVMRGTRVRDEKKANSKVRHDRK